MGIRQLEEFLGQADQKGFWVFSYANLASAFFGAFLGNGLLDALAPSLKLPGIVAGVVLGVAVTWKVRGRPIYGWALSYALFALRRYIRVGMGECTIDSGLYYRSRAVVGEPFVLVATRDGRAVPVLVHRGSGTGSPADLLDGLLVAAHQPHVWEPVESTQAAGAVSRSWGGEDGAPQPVGIKGDPVRVRTSSAVTAAGYAPAYSQSRSPAYTPEQLAGRTPNDTTGGQPSGDHAGDHGEWGL